MNPKRPLTAAQLLIAPIVLLAAILALVVLVGSLPPPVTPNAPEMATVAPPVTPDRPQECRRDQHGALEIIERFPGEGERVTSALVLACPAAFDGKRVTYAGEVIGESLERDGGAWVLVNDDDYAITVGPLPRHRERRGTNTGLTVWLPDPLSARLSGFGRPHQRGDLVEIEGHIMRTDPEDGGGLTLRASSMEILGRSQTFVEPLRIPQALLAAGSLAAAGLIGVGRRRT